MSVATAAARDTASTVDWRRVGRRTGIAAIVVVASILFLRNALASGYAVDFRGGIWSAGWAMLHGHSPYPAVNAAALLAQRHAFVTPPPLGVIGIPFALLPFGPAAVVWNILCVSAFVGALALLGIRDTRMYALSLASIPLFDSLTIGQPEGLLVLLAVLAWRYRDAWPGGLSVGVLIALKLLPLPLLAWLLVTRRIRSLAVACVSAAALLAGSWALIGFKGLTAYPHLLSADAHAFQRWRYSYSLVHGLGSFGIPVSAARWVAVLVAAGVAAAIVRRARGSDLGWFTAALTFGILVSPLLWLHYLLLLFVPMAISHRRSLGIWLTAAYGFWAMLILLPPGSLRALVAIAIASGLAIWSAANPTPRSGAIDFSRMRGEAVA